jgi:hypothetical protein
MYEDGGIPDRNGAGTAAAVDRSCSAAAEFRRRKVMAVSADALSFQVEANSANVFRHGRFRKSGRAGRVSA